VLIESVILLVLVESLLLLYILDSFYFFPYFNAVVTIGVFSETEIVIR